MSGALWVAIAFAVSLTGQMAYAQVDAEGIAQTSPLPVANSVPSPFSLFAAGETMVFAQGGTGLFGVRAGARFQPDPAIALHLDLGVLGGSARDPLGTITETIGTLGASLFATGSANGISFGVGPRLEGGLGWFRGTPGGPQASGASAQSALFFVALSGTGSFRIGGAWSGFIGIDAGTSVYAFEGKADGRSVSDMRGAMMVLRVGGIWDLKRR